MSTLPAEPVLLLGATHLAMGLASLLSEGRKTAAKPDAEPSVGGSVALFVPCCGDEPGLEANLESLLSQDHPDYRVVFVVEHASDGAVSVIERCRGRHPGMSELVVAGPAWGRSQKVHNLSVAVMKAVRGRESPDVLAFADSDGRPRSDWLRQLVSGLGRRETGVASSYRFYVPGDPARFATLLRSVWNLSVASLLGDHGRNFAWGGAMALRREVFEAIGVLEAWKAALSDDYAVTHVVRRAGLRVHYVPEATVPSHGDAGMRELLDWTTRQIRITRVYWPALFRMAAVSHLSYAGFLAVAPFAGGFALGLLAVVLAVSGASGVARARKAPIATPSRHLWAHGLLVPLASLVTGQAVLRALGSRQLVWRGKRYEMRSPTETVVLP